MALGKLSQSSCCWNCAVHTNLLSELALSPRFGHEISRACWLPHLKPYHLELFIPKASGSWATDTCWACATWKINLKFEIYNQTESSLVMVFLCSQTELWITKRSTKFVETGCPHCLSSQHNLTDVPQWKVLHLSVLTSTKIPVANHFSSSCQFIFVNHLVAAALLLSGKALL